MSEESRAKRSRLDEALTTDMMTKAEHILEEMKDDLSEEQISKLTKVLDKYIHEVKKTKTNDELWTNYYDSRVSLGYQPTTLKQYKYEVYSLINSLSKHACDIETSDIKDYIMKYKASRPKVSPTTVNNKLAFIFPFFEYLVCEGYMNRNPVKGVERNRKQIKVKKAFSQQELKAIRDSAIDLRERALIEFLYGTGARISEVAKATMKEVDLKNNEILLHGKGNKERLVFLPESSLKIIKKYAKKYRKGAKPNDPFFTTVNKYKGAYKQLTVRSLEKTCKAFEDRTGIDHIHPHRFRRTLATDLLSNKVDIVLVKELLGHSDLDTTMIYCDTNKLDVKNALLKTIK